MEWKSIVKNFDAYRIPIREHLNPIFGASRLKRLHTKSFTIISNNCWGGHVYRYFHIPYLSPTVGLYFYAEDYVRFVSNQQYYCKQTLHFIPPEKSRHYKELLERGNTYAPLGVLGDDVEIVFLHYKTEEEAQTKWMRRVERMNWQNIIIKFSEQNGATPDHLRKVDALSFDRKLIFTSHDYGLSSQVIFREYEGLEQIPDETTHFRRYVNLVNFINGRPFKKHQ